MSLTLQTYIQQLQEFLDDNPELAEAEVWYASDDEGNNYQKVGYSPSLKVIEKDEDYSTDIVYNQEEALEELAPELGIYEDDFNTAEEYRAHAQAALDEQYKTIVVVN